MFITIRYDVMRKLLSGKPGTVSQLTAAETAQILNAASGNSLRNLEERLRANILQRRRLERQLYLDSTYNPTIDRCVF